MLQFVNLIRCFVCFSDVPETSCPNSLSTSSDEDDEDSGDDDVDDSASSSVFMPSDGNCEPTLSLESIYSMLFKNVMKSFFFKLAELICFFFTTRSY